MNQVQQTHIRPPTHATNNRTFQQRRPDFSDQYVPIISGLEQQDFIDEHTASLLKTLIVEENGEILRLMHGYASGAYDD